MLIDSVPRITIANERSRSRSDRTNEKCCYPIGILMLLIACKLWCTDKIVKSAKLSDRSFQSINQNSSLSELRVDKEVSQGITHHDSHALCSIISGAGIHYGRDSPGGLLLITVRQLVPAECKKRKISIGYKKIPVAAEEFFFGSWIGLTDPPALVELTSLDIHCCFKG